jgi:hypothetical protein
MDAHGRSLHAAAAPEAGYVTAALGHGSPA